MKPPQKALICARADDKWVVPGSAFNLFCSRCETRVMVAPSGIRMLKREPDIVVLCIPCGRADAKAVAATGEKIEVGSAASLDELIAELRASQPNFWRKRN